MTCNHIQDSIMLACTNMYLRLYMRVSPYPHAYHIALIWKIYSAHILIPSSAKNSWATELMYLYLQFIENCHIIFWRHGESRVFPSWTSLSWARAGARNRELFPTLLGDVVPTTICLKWIHSNLSIGVRIVKHLCSFLTSLDLKAKWYMHQKRWTRYIVSLSARTNRKGRKAWKKCPARGKKTQNDFISNKNHRLIGRARV